MAARIKQQHVTGGMLWGDLRVQLGISLATLAERSGVPKGTLSLMEHGRVMPTSTEWSRIMAALAAAGER